MTDFARLGLEIDATSAQEASDALDNLTAASERSGVALSKQEQQWLAEGKTLEEMAKKADEFSAGLNTNAGATTQGQRATERYISALQKQVETFGMSRAQLAAYRASQLEFTEEQAHVVAANLQTLDSLERSGDGLEAVGLKSRRARDQLGLLARDILRGDFSQVGNRLGQFIAQSELSLASMVRFVAPAAAAVGSIVALTQAFNQGEKETIAFNNALLVSGNYAGMTRQQMLDLARSIEDTGNLTASESRKIVQELVGSGQISGNAINQIANVAEGLARATGRDIDKIGSELVKIFNDPAKGAEELNKQMNFLSVTELKRLQYLTELGREGEAQVILAAKLNERLAGMNTNLGTLESVWGSVRRAASAAWDAMMNVGREDTLEKQLQKAQAVLDQAQAGLGISPEMGGTRPEDVTSAQAVVDHLQAMVQAQAEAADESSRRVAAERQAHRLAEEQKQLREHEIQDIVRLEEHENRTRNAAITGRHQLGEITQAERDKQLLASDLELATTKLLANEKQRGAENIGRIEMARLESEAKIIDIQRRARIEDFERATALLLLTQRRAQAEADARSAQATTTDQLGDIEALRAGNEALRERQREIGLTREQVDMLSQSMINMKIAQLELDIGAAGDEGLTEEDPYILRLREQIRLLEERKDLEAAVSGASVRQGQFDVEYEALVRARDLELLTEAEFDEEELNMRTRHEANILGITSRSAMERLRLQQMTGAQQVKATIGYLEAMTGAAAHHSRAMFEIHKVASLANAVVKGIEAVQGAYAWGSTIGGPYVGAAMAAIAFAAQAINVAAIANSQFGGGVASPNFGGNVTVAQVPQTSPITGQPSAPQSGISLSVIIEGNVIGNEAFVRDTLVPVLKDVIDNQDVTIIGKNSRQASELTS